MRRASALKAPAVSLTSATDVAAVFARTCRAASKQLHTCTEERTFESTNALETAAEVMLVLLLLLLVVESASRYQSARTHEPLRCILLVQNTCVVHTT